MSVDWDIVAKAQLDPGQGIAERYTQWQILTAAMKGLRYTRQTIWWDRDEPLSILKTDLWTEGIVRSREILDSFVHLAWANGYYVSQYSTCSFDISRVTCLKAAAANTPGDIVQADVRHLPYKPNSFDIIIDPSTTDHTPLPDALSAFSGYYQALRPDGVLVLAFAHYGGTLTKNSGSDYYAFSINAVRNHLRTLGFRLKGEWAIHCLNTQPLGILMSSRLGMARLAVAAYMRLEYSLVSRYILRPFAPLYVMIAKK